MIKRIIYLLRIFKSFESPIILKWAQQLSIQAIVARMICINLLFIRKPCNLMWILHIFYMNFTQGFHHMKHVNNNYHKTCPDIMRTHLHDIRMRNFYVWFLINLIKSHVFIWIRNHMKKNHASNLVI